MGPAGAEGRRSEWALWRTNSEGSANVAPTGRAPLLCTGIEKIGAFPICQRKRQDPSIL
jgi:hypothetical protein